MRKIYLDNSATTRPYPEVINKMVQMLTDTYGNPSSSHELGKESRLEIERARGIIAKTLGAEPEEIYFTSGGTEADNLAIKGACLANSGNGNRIVTTTAEHPAVTKTIRDLRKQGWEVAYIPAPNGELDLQAMEKAIDAKTALVSTMLVNNETGHIFPVHKIKEIINKKNSSALLHCDAVQGYGKLPFTANSLGADLITISGHKIHGPKGVGALYVKKGTKMFTTIFGGGQERGLRSGTENTPAIAAFGEAARITFANMGKNISHMNSLRLYCKRSIELSLSRAILNSPVQGAPHIVNFSLPGLNNKQVVEYLDSRNIYISSAAACKGNHSRGPSILESLGLSRELADSALRVSFSHLNSVEDIDVFIETLSEYCMKNQ